MKKFLGIMQSVRILAGVLLCVLYCAAFMLFLLFIERFEEIRPVAAVLSLLYLILWLVAAIGYGISSSRAYLPISCVYWACTFISFSKFLHIPVIGEVLYLAFFPPVYGVVSLTSDGRMLLLGFIAIHFLLYLVFRRTAGRVEKKS